MTGAANVPTLHSCQASKRAYSAQHNCCSDAASMLALVAQRLENLYSRGIKLAQHSADNTSHLHQVVVANAFKSVYSRSAILTVSKHPTNLAS